MQPLSRFSSLYSQSIVIAACCALPSLGLAQKYQGDNFIYVVQRGDTFDSVKSRYVLDNVSWHEIAKLNGISQDRRLPVGKTLTLKSEWLTSQQSKGKVAAISGKVSVNGQPAALDMLVNEKSTILTDPESAIVIVFTDGSSVRIGSASSVVIDKLKQYHDSEVVEARIRLEKGRVETVAAEKRKRSFEITTPGATAAVRGTRFGVSRETIADQTRPSVDVDNGEVAWAGKNPQAQVPIPKGFGAGLNLDGSPSNPEALLPPINTASLPTATATVSSDIKFEPLAGANAYRIQISNQPNFAALTQELISTTSGFKLNSDIDGNHFVRVKALSAQMVEGKSAEAVISVAARPEAPKQIQTGNATSFSPEVGLEWTSATPATTRYRLQTSQGRDFGQISTDLTLNESKAVVKFSTGASFLRIAAIDSNGKQGPYSDIKPITVRLIPAAPLPKLTRNELQFLDAAAFSEPNAQIELQWANDVTFSQGFTSKLLSNNAEKILLNASSYFLRSRYIVQGVDAKFSPFSSVSSFRITQTLDSPVSGPIRTGDGQPVILSF